MITELLIASYIGVQPYKAQNQIGDFVFVESEITKREREEAEKIVFRTSTKKGSSYTGGEATKLYEDSTNNCVAWSKKQTGISGTLGNGARAGIQGTEPRIGAIGAEKGGIPHAFVVVAIKDDTIIINESNFIKNWISQREIPKSRVLGYVYR